MKKFCALLLLSKHLIAVFIGLILISLTSHSEDVILRHSFAGNISFELAGNTLRRTNNTCRPLNSGQSSSTITLPNNSSIKAAYLYWSGSGVTDSTAIFNGQAINADISYIESFQSRDYYSSKADVTAFISSNRISQYTVSGVTFDGSNTYCSSGGAYGGWALAVIYQNSNEPLRVINLFDGFKNFWGNQFSLIPNNFVIAQNPAAKGGKHAHITWEGDDGNSQALNNQTESLKFEGVNLTDVDNPSSNQFNGFSNVTGATSGVDVDEYDIGNYLTAGATSVSTTYSSGQDAVFLTAELISVPNEPVADLSIQQSGPSFFIKGQSNNIDFNVINLGPNTASSNSQITIPLVNGLSLESFSGNNWSCSSNVSEISCIYQAEIINNSTADSLTISFIANQSTANSISLVSTVTGVLFDNILSNNTQNKSYTVTSPDLSTSTKTVTDLNGGNVQAGDTLRYQIDIKETNGVEAKGVSLTDHLDANIDSFTVVNLPALIANNSLLAPAGSNGAGIISLNNITVAANSNITLTIDAVIKSPLNTNTTINNIATISSVGLTDISVASPTVFISQPLSPSAGDKPLYLRQNNTLSRIKPTSNGFITISDQAQSTLTIAPSFQQDFSFSDSLVKGYLFLQNDFNSGSWNHTVTLSLLLNGIAIGNVQKTVTVPSQGLTNDNVGLFDFAIPIPSGQTFQTGDSLALKIENDSEYDVDSLRIYSTDPNVNTADIVSPHSLISLPAATVINIDQIKVLNRVTTALITEASQSQSLSIQAVVSDPFGSFDITSASISITNPLGVQVIPQQNMSEFSDSGVAIKTYQYNYNLASDAEIGNWKIEINAKEGSENDISHSSEYTLQVMAPLPNITLTKSVIVFSDPIHGINGSNNFSKALPGAILTYTIKAQNIGQGVAENNSVWISDAIPDKTFMLVKNFDDISAQGPVIEQPVNPSSGLNYQFITLDSNSDDIEFSDNNGLDFDYSPSPDSEGIDKQITHFRINPTGVFQAPAAGESANQFSIKFRVQLQ